MGASPTAIIGIYVEYRLNMAAFALWFRTIIQIQAGVIACT